VYCSVKSGNDSPKVFTYTGSNAFDIPVKIDANGNNSVKFNIYSNDPTMVSVDRKYTGREVGIRKGTLPVATTGHTEDELKLIEQAAEKIAIFKTANMSLGINLLIELSKKATELLQDDFDIEIIEKHHNQKLDAPSGTALLIADSLKESLKFEGEYVYDRHTKREKRRKEEIGIHSIRGGTIVGEHEVLFAGPDEIVSIAHRADSRKVFVKGALNAARYIENKPAGIYDMSMLLNEKLN
jgi:4-hydroxy-tetrahydrodipicolinate reductase